MRRFILMMVLAVVSNSAMAEFTCEKIKDKATRASCIEDRVAKDKAVGKVGGARGKPKEIKLVELSGQVFIVTRGRDNIKLALVNIYAFPEKDVFQHNVKLLEKVVQIQQIENQELQSAREEAKEVEAATKNPDSPPDSSQLEQYISKTLKYKEISKKGITTIDGKYYFANLPAPLVTSKTDADGKFNLSLPQGKYVIAAESSRDVVGRVENYYWLVWVDATSPNNSVILSNDNLFETRCDACVDPLRTRGFIE